MLPLAVGIVLVLGTGLLNEIPTAALAAVVIAAVLRLIDLSAFRWLFRVNRGDFALATHPSSEYSYSGSFLASGSPSPSRWLPCSSGHGTRTRAVLGRVPALKGYHDTLRHPEGAQVPGLLLFRFDAPLFFANAEVFREALHRALAAERRSIWTVVVAAEPITDVDSTAAEVLGEIDAELERHGIELAFAELKGPVRDKLLRYGLVEQVGERRFYPTIGLAVHAHVDEHGIDWHDWEDRGEDR